MDKSGSANFNMATQILGYHPEISDKKLISWKTVRSQVRGQTKIESGPTELRYALSLGGVLVIDRKESTEHEWVVKHVSRMHLQDDLSVTSFRYSSEFSHMKVRVVWPSAFCQSSRITSAGGELHVLMSVPESLKRLVGHIMQDPQIHRRYVWTDAIGVTFLRDICNVEEEKLWKNMASMYLQYVTIPALNYYDEPEYFYRLWMFQEFSFGRMLLKRREGSDAAETIARLRNNHLDHGSDLQLLGLNRALLNPASLAPRIADHICVCIETKGYTNIQDLEVACFGVLATSLGRELPKFDWVVHGKFSGRAELHERLLQQIPEWLESEPEGKIDFSIFQKCIEWSSPPQIYFRSYGFCPLEVNKAAQSEFKQEMAKWHSELSSSWREDLLLVLKWVKASRKTPIEVTPELHKSAQRLAGTLTIVEQTGGILQQNAIKDLVFLIRCCEGKKLSFVPNFGCCDFVSLEDYIKVYRKKSDEYVSALSEQFWTIVGTGI